MDIRNPHVELETEAHETLVVDYALDLLSTKGLLESTDYDHDRFAAFRASVRASFDVPWTAITPRMQRLIWAINAIHRPAVMIAAGVFCGFTYICNAGAATGPGKSYEARHLIGVEIDEREAERARRNLRAISSDSCARILGQDAVAFVADWGEEIDLLYLDATGGGNTGKGLYYDILCAAEGKLSDGALVLAHNSYNAAGELSAYLSRVRSDHFRCSVNVVLDGEGLEVSQW
jgi:predicted O-methyltransferase YrrM